MIASQPAQPPLLVIAGPTASGKSSLAIRCAEALNGEVLSVDSVQIYRGLDIGSAKVSRQERERLSHHGIDIRSPHESFNVADFLEVAEGALASMAARAKQPVVCAGTTLYLTALLHGLVDAPQANPELRAALEELSDEELHAELSHVDPAAAQRIAVRDRVRAVRAIEAGKGRTETLSSLQAAHSYGGAGRRALIVVLCWPRKALYERINRRASEMVQGGLLDEVRRIREQYPHAAHALRTLGYAQAVEVLDGKLAEQQLETVVAMQTRRYAKRQTTYWRNEPRKRGWNITKGTAQDVKQQQGNSRSVQELRGVSMPLSELLAEAQRTLATPRYDIELWYLDAEPLM